MSREALALLDRPPHESLLETPPDHFFDTQAGTVPVSLFELISEAEFLERPLKSAAAIDPPNPDEVDDAINIQKIGRGNGDWRVEVHIADVGLLYGWEGVLAAARAQGWSEYDYEIPESSKGMFPERINKRILGLDSGGEHGAPSVEVAFSFNEHTKSVGDIALTKSRVICEQLTYEEHDKMMSDVKSAAHMLHVGQALNQNVRPGEKLRKGSRSSDAVTRIMVATNMIMAQEMKKSDHGLWLFRNYGSEIFDALRGKKEQRLLAEMRARGVGVYDRRSTGHLGVGVIDYCHFTSPLRRWPDAVNHLILHADMNGLTLPYDAAQLDVESDHISRLHLARRGVDISGFDLVA